MGHENWQLRMSKNMAGGSPEDHLPEAALSVGTLEEKICP